MAVQSSFDTGREGMLSQGALPTPFHKQSFAKQLLSILLGFPVWKLNVCPTLWLLPVPGSRSVGGN